MARTTGELRVYSQQDEQNRVLRALPASSYLRLRPYLEPVTFSLKQVLWKPTPSSTRCISANPFSVPDRRLADGVLVEAATVGNEGIVGMAAVLDGERASMLALAQMYRERCSCGPRASRR